MAEWYVRRGRLIARAQFEAEIASLKTTKTLAIKALAFNVLKHDIPVAITNRMPAKPFGVLFSGGLDSTLIAVVCKRAAAPFTCYTVGLKAAGLKASEDIEWATKVAHELRLDHRIILLSLEDAGRLFARTARVLGPDLLTVVNVGVGAVGLAGLEAAKRDGHRAVFSGLGSEEIFAGYERHRRAADVQAECWRGLAGMYGRDLRREAAISASAGVEVLTPFLDKNLIRDAMEVAPALKVRGDVTKYILREVAASLGVPAPVTRRKKRAAQYGSRLDRALEIVAKRHGAGKDSFVRRGCR